MPPGAYTVTLTVDGQEHTRPLRVLKDPNTAGTEADIATQVALLRNIRTDLETGGRAVQRVEAVRVQLQTLARFSEDEEVKAGARALEQKIIDLEMELVDLRLTGQGQDAVRFESRTLGKLGYLAGALANGDFRPTDQQVEVQGILNARVHAQVAALDAVLTTDLAALNELLRTRGLQVISETTR
jgi:hypothetical protein